MTKKGHILLIIAGAAIIILSAFTVVNSGGTQWWSGSPWDGGAANGTCASCHSGGATVPGCSVTASPAFGSGNTAYMPGQTYTITVVAGGSYAAYGFNLEILNSTSASTAVDAGTFGAPVSNNTRIITSSGNPTTASHNSPSNTPFQFKWTAPTNGPAYLYAVCNGVNLDAATTGDRVSAITGYTLNPMTGISQYTNNTVHLHMSPNPATDNLRLVYTLSQYSNVSVKLCSLNGQVVAELFRDSQQGLGPQIIETHLPTGLAKGTYLIKLSINEREILEKLMIY